MEFDQLVAIVRRKIQDDTAAFTGHLVNGRCADFAEYSKQAGIIQGLLRAEQYLVDASKQEEDDQG